MGNLSFEGLVHLISFYMYFRQFEGEVSDFGEFFWNFTWGSLRGLKLEGVGWHQFGGLDLKGVEALPFHSIYIIKSIFVCFVVT